MFIEVIPFGGSIDDEGLTYFARDELAETIQIGCLVEVPFRNALDYAIVTDIFLPSPSRRGAGGEVGEDRRGAGGEVENVRSIVRVITTTPLLAPYQIRSIFQCASYYFVHTHHILSLFLPKMFVKYLEKRDFGALKTIPFGDDAEEYKKGAIADTEKTTNKIHFYHHTSETPFFQALQGHAREGTLLIFPDDFSIDAYLKNCPQDGESTLVIYDKCTDTAKIKAFTSVYNGEKNIIIGTRRILYYNLSRYHRIFYIEDALHKTAMRFNHTYKHLEILRTIAQESHIEITIFSSLPSIESMYLLHTGVYEGSGKLPYTQGALSSRAKGNVVEGSL